MKINSKITIKKISITFFALLMINQVQALEHIYAGNHQVDRYYPINDDFIYLRMEAATLDPAGCGAAATSYYAMVRADVSAFDEYRKVILTAKAGGLNLLVYVRSEAGNCYGKAPKISRIILD